MNVEQKNLGASSQQTIEASKPERLHAIYKFLEFDEL